MNNRILHNQLSSKQDIKPFFAQNLPNKIEWVSFDDYESNWGAAASLFR